MSAKKSTPLIFILLTILLSFGSSVALAGKEPDNVTSSRIAFEDEVEAIAVQGDYGYVLHGDMLSVLDISNPLSVQILGSAPAMFATDLVVEGDYAYTTGWSDLIILNVSNPHFPFQVAMIDELRNYQRTVAYHDGYLYIGSRGLSIVDVSDPKSPREVSYFNRNLGEITKVIVAPDPTGESERVYAYLATIHDPWYRGGGLIIVDVTDPANPQHVFPGCDDGCGDATYGTFDLAMQGRYVYLPESDYLLPENYGLEVWDVSDPAHTLLVSRYRIPDTPTYKVAMQGDQVYTTGVALNDNDREVLLTVDVAEKGQPRQAGLRDMVHTRTQGGGIVTAGDCLYIPQGAAGLEILCESNVTPTPPKLSFLPLLTWFGG